MCKWIWWIGVGVLFSGCMLLSATTLPGYDRSQENEMIPTRIKCTIWHIPTYEPNTLCYIQEYDVDITPCDFEQGWGFEFTDPQDPNSMYYLNIHQAWGKPMNLIEYNEAAKDSLEKVRFVRDHWLQTTTTGMRCTVWKDHRPYPLRRIFVGYWNIGLNPSHYDQGWGVSFTNPGDSFPVYNIIVQWVWYEPLVGK